MEGEHTTETATSTAEPQHEVELLIRQWYPLVLTCIIVMSIVSVPGNVLTAVAYFRTPHLQTSTNLLICNLSIADVMVAVAALPFFSMSFTTWGISLTMTSQAACLLGLWLTFFSAMSSLTNLSLLSLERVIAIVCPYRYYTLVTDAALRRVIITSWAFTLVVTALPVLGWNTYETGQRCTAMNVYPKTYSIFVFTSVCAFLLLSTMLMNMVTAVVAAKKFRVQIVSHPPNSNDHEGASGHQRVTKMLLTVFGVFYITWTPYLLLTGAITMTPHHERAFLPSTLFFLHDFSKILVGLNSVLNPLIYAKSNKKIRSAFRNLLKL